MKQILTTFFIFVTFFLSADPSIMKIESFGLTKDKTSIYLDNGTHWSYGDNDLFVGNQGWKLGDRIEIVSVYFDGYYLKNLSCEGCVPVALKNASSKEIEAFRIEEIILNRKKENLTIILEDGTHWFIGSWSSVLGKKWEAGDRVLVTTQDFLFGNAEHLLINLDRLDFWNAPENIRAQRVYPAKVPRLKDENKREGRSYTHYLTSAWMGEENFMIEIDHDTVWSCSLPKKNWKEGDEFVFISKDESLKIENLKKKEQVEVVFSSSESPLQVEQVSQKGTKLRLSDGSIWLSSFSGGFKDWNLGDRMVVSEASLSFDATSHLLINVEQSCQSAILVR